ncbi:MAG: DUF1028 domain-containing protein [Flavobacteriaceae bacterium]|nr:DUF1028 domain-containing protein [Flavobacteriaceae bacterium]
MQNLKKNIAYLLLLFTIALQSQVYKDKFAHTFSVVARDPATGEMAVGVQSHWFSVGTIVAWGKSGVGVVATQSFVNPAYGPNGLQLMENGITAKQAMDNLIAKDEGREVRQVAMLDNKGNAHAFTGEKCIASAGHFVGDNFSVQANMMLNDEVVPAMAKAYLKNSGLPLAERVLATLKAAQEAGGDIRGQQSAALIVVGGQKVTEPWKDKLVDLRVDDHNTPIKELERLLRVHRAYDFMNKGDLAIEQGDMKNAMEAYAEAQKLFPENLEMKYWTAVTMANNGQLEKSLPVFKEIFTTDPNWRELTRRLPKVGLLTLSQEELVKVLQL